MNKKLLIIAIIIVLIAVVGVVWWNISNNQKNKENKEQKNMEQSTLENSEETNQEIGQIKQETGATGNENLYNIIEEYDGRKILQIKPELQFQAVLAGIIKTEKPLEEEIPTLLEKAPSKTGIWISENSRNYFIELLKQNEVTNCNIDENGYLTAENEIIKNASNSNNLYIIDCSGKSYSRDELTGEILEYPFEEMDPYQVMDIYENKNQKIMEITTNKTNKLTSKEMFDEITEYLKT